MNRSLNHYQVKRQPHLGPGCLSGGRHEASAQGPMNPTCDSGRTMRFKYKLPRESIDSTNARLATTCQSIVLEDE
jgi:hypothetical protein